MSRKPTKRCNQCGGLVARPGLFKCDEQHAKPTVAQSIVTAIEEDIRDRRGLKGAFESIDQETQQEIRDQWAELIGDVIGERWSEIYG